MSSLREQPLVFSLRHGTQASFPGRWRQSTFLYGIRKNEANRRLRQVSPKWQEPQSDITDPFGDLFVASLSGRNIRKKYIDLLKKRGVSRSTINSIRSLLEL